MFFSVVGRRGVPTADALADCAELPHAARLVLGLVGMISTGSAVPNIGGAGNFPATYAGSLARRRASWALLVLACALVPSSGNSDSDSLATRNPPIPGVASVKGDIVVTARGRNAQLVQGTTPDLFAGRLSAALVPVLASAERYPAAALFAPRPARKMAGERTKSLRSDANKVASLSPELPYVKQAHTDLIGFDNSAFPYLGKNPGTGESVLSQASRYSDNRVLVHVPAGFDVRKAGVIVVFFHGHGATLERDVRDRQLLPAQISESGANAVLVAPQLAYDAADSSAGKFWERGGLKRFMAEAAGHLARVYGDPRAADAFAKMPVVIVAYSGGFVSAAYSLHVGGLGRHIIGVVLLDALYGELDKFSSWILNNRSAFFVSAYTRYTKRRDDELARILRDKGVPVSYQLDGPLKPGTVAFLGTGEGVQHRDYVTLAWTEHPVKDVLQRVAQR
jgi:hypothetical protein